VVCSLGVIFILCLENYFPHAFNGLYFQDKKILIIEQFLDLKKQSLALFQTPVVFWRTPVEKLSQHDFYLQPNILESK